MLTRWRVATSLAPAAEEASGANIVDRRRTSLQHREVLGRRTLLLRIVAPRRQQVQVRVLGTRCGSEACRAVVGHASCCEMGAAVVGRGALCCEMGAAVVGRGLLLCVAVLAGRKLLQITDLIADALLSVAPWHWRTDCRRRLSMRQRSHLGRDLTGRVAEKSARLRICSEFPLSTQKCRPQSSARCY